MDASRTERAWVDVGLAGAAWNDGDSGELDLRERAMSELRHAALRSAFVRPAARYVPELRPGDVEPAFAGMRAQALGRDGRLLDDFVFFATPRALHVRNAPSPAATASLAIARHVPDEARRAFGLES